MARQLLVLIFIVSSFACCLSGASSESAGRVRPGFVARNASSSSSSDITKRDLYCGSETCDTGSYSCCDGSTDPCCTLQVGEGTCCPDGCYDATDANCCGTFACRSGTTCCGDGNCCSNGATCVSGECQAPTAPPPTDSNNNNNDNNDNNDNDGDGDSDSDTMDMSNVGLGLLVAGPFVLVVSFTILCCISKKGKGNVSGCTKAILILGIMAGLGMSIAGGVIYGTNQTYSSSDNNSNPGSDNNNDNNNNNNDNDNNNNNDNNNACSVTAISCPSCDSDDPEQACLYCEAACDSYNACATSYCTSNLQAASELGTDCQAVYQVHC